MIADKIITIYRPVDKKVLAQVNVGESYNCPDTVEIFHGTIDQFLSLHPDYEKIDK